MKKTETMNTMKIRKELLWRFLPVMAPVMAVAVICLISRTLPWRLDAWNTTWNDESGYYRIIRMIRTIGSPAGAYGFNESRSRILAYGSYNPPTYLPYVLLSFLTGTSSHNYVYVCNILLGVCGCLAYVLLGHPDRKRCFWVTAFIFSQPILVRYFWSGMSEGSYVFFLMLFTSLGIFAVRKTQDTGGEKAIWQTDGTGRKSAGRTLVIISVIQCAVCCLWCVMRPNYVACFLLPTVLLWQTARGRKLPVRLAPTLPGPVFAAASLWGYVYFRRNYIPQYFGGAKPSDAMMACLRSGQLWGAFKELISLNLKGLRTIGGSLAGFGWAGWISVLFMVEWVLLCILLIRLVMSRPAGADTGEDGRKADAETGKHSCSPGTGDRNRNNRQNRGTLTALYVTLLLEGLVTWEATVVLYNPAQLHRMLLALSVSYALLLIHYGDKEKWIHEAVLLAILLVLAVGRPSGLALPQINKRTISKEKAQASVTRLEKRLPRQEDPWENTIAKPVETRRMQYQFLIPDWMALNVCGVEYLREHIEADTLKSRYVLLGSKSDLNELCKEKYKVIWKKYGKVLYRRP